MRRLTLSFDNGPTPDTTPAVLDELAARGLSAWFCVVGRCLGAQGGADIARRVLDDGHRIVNHSLSHAVPLGDDPAPHHARREIGEMHDLLDETLGDWGERWFRPFGREGRLGPHVFSPAAVDLLADHRYSVLMWNSVPRDWVDPDGWVDTALADVERTDHTVIVLHDLPTGAMRHLPRFLDAITDRGVDVVIDPPDGCVAMRNGVPRASLTPLVTSGP